MDAYATADEYRAATGDESVPDARLEAALGAQSAKLRALLGISGELDGDALTLARELVVDACRKAFVTASGSWGAGGGPGVTQSTFSANGFSESVQYSNPSGSAYFDRSTLAALKRLLGKSMAVGTMCPGYGGGR